MARVRVLIVDDSAAMRGLLTATLRRDPELEVVGAAADPLEARELIRALNPDVLTLDVEMPKMDGLTFLKNLMRLRPMPVVMVSTLTARGADVTMQALALGAVDFFTKPTMQVSERLDDDAELLIAKVKAAARARVTQLGRTPAPASPVIKSTASASASPRVIALGASTGGTEALSEVFRRFPADAPGTVVAQHIPPVFSARWAARLDEMCAVTVHEARDGELILRGHVYIAPGGRHLRVRRRGAEFVCSLGDDEPVNRHRPSVDALFDSVLECQGAQTVAGLLTGMGADGAAALGRLHAAGAHTLAQDEASSVVWGMPGEAVKRGFVTEVVSLDQFAERVLAASPQRRSQRAAS